MLKKMLKKMPKTYAFCQHMLRRKKIKIINKRKKLTWEQKIALVEKIYYIRIGHKLDWNNLTTYTEKMQWYKMYDYDIRKSILSDKLAVRKWIEEKIGKKYLIPLLGAWSNFDDINFDLLPNQFVLKTNNGSGTNLIVRNKMKLNKKLTRRLVNDWLDTDFAYYNPFEFQYSKIKPMIIAEKFMGDGLRELPDYKFLCFDGNPTFCWVDMNRYSNHTRNVYDMNWNLQSWNQCLHSYDEIIPKPKCFEEMKKIASLLSKGFSHVRVDLYVINDKVYFGEMTFTNGSGFEKIYPDSADVMLGELWKIDNK